MQGGLGQLRPPHRILDRLQRRGLGVEPRFGRRALLAAQAFESRRPAACALGRIGTKDRRRTPGRLVPATGRVDDDLIGAARLEPLAQRLRGRQLAEAQHQLRHGVARPVLVAQQRVVGGDDVGAVVGAEAHLRGRLGEDREAGGAREVGEGLTQLGVGLATGDDHARDRVADVARDLVEDEAGRLEVDARHRRERASAFTAVERERVGRGNRALDRDRCQRLAPGEVEVDRAGADLTACPGQRARRHRAHVEEARVVGVVRPDFAEPAHGLAEGLDLVDHLAGPDTAQLRRPVGAEDDQRQPRLVGLGDRGVVVRERGAGGAEQRDRLAARLRRSQREEPGGTLVEDHRHLDLRLPPQRHRERRRARSR